MIRDLLLYSFQDVASAPVAKPAQAGPSAPEAAAAPEVIRGIEEHQQTQIVENQESVRKKAQQATQQLNQFMESFNKGIHFRIHEATGQTYVQIVDKATDKVLRELPSRDMLDMLARFHDVLGMIYDDQG